MPTENAGTNALKHVLTDYRDEVLAAWPYLQGRRGGRAASDSRNALGAELLDAIAAAAAAGDLSDLSGPEWNVTREILESMSRSGAQQGATPSETATAVLSLKGPVLARIRESAGQDLDAFARGVETATRLLDQLALYTTEVFQKTREDILSRQSEDLLELSTPVIKLWDGVLALPMIGTLDSSRTQAVMEALLQKIVEIEAEVAIIDITGVPTVDTLTAQHLLKTVTAARLMGTDCIISGIRPQIAQTIVHLGVDLSGVVTKATLADAFALALKRLGLAVVSSSSRE